MSLTYTVFERKGRQGIEVNRVSSHEGNPESWVTEQAISKKVSLLGGREMFYNGKFIFQLYSVF